jgi:hypothetical protein
MLIQRRHAPEGAARERVAARWAAGDARPKAGLADVGLDRGSRVPNTSPFAGVQEPWRLLQPRPEWPDLSGRRGTSARRDLDQVSARTCWMVMTSFPSCGVTTYQMVTPSAGK